MRPFGNDSSFSNTWVSHSRIPQRGEPRDIVKDLDTLAEQDYSAAKIALAWIARDVGNIPQAIEILEGIKDEHGAVAELSSGMLGHFLYDNGDVGDRVIELLTQGGNAYPTARADLAAALISQDRTDEALAVLRRGMDAGEPESMLPLGNLLWERGDVVQVRKAFEASFALGDLNSAYNLGLMLREQGDPEYAIWLGRGKPPAG